MKSYNDSLAEVMDLLALPSSPLLQFQQSVPSYSYSSSPDSLSQQWSPAIVSEEDPIQQFDNLPTDLIKYENALMSPLQTNDVKLNPVSQFNGHLCQVCHRPCEKRLFYGAHVCHGCRTFFRRAAAGNRHQNFRCMTSAVCQDNNSEKIWIRCQKCRFVRCLQAGMQISTSMAQHERSARNNDVRVNENAPVLRNPVADKMTLEETVFMTQLFSQNIQHLGQLSAQNFFVHPDLASQIVRYFSLFESLSGQSVHLMEMLIKTKGQAFFLQLGDMERLPTRDQTMLLAENYPAVVEFVQSLWCSEPKLSRRMLKESFSALSKAMAFEKESSQKMWISRLLGNDINPEIHGDTSSQRYDSFYKNFWAISKNGDRVKHEQLYHLMASGIPNTGPENFDVISMLVILIIIFSSEGIVTLANRKLVDAIRNKYIHMLHKYLKENLREDERQRILERAMQVGRQAKEASELKEKMYECRK